jgi:hypothetical protein
MKKFLILLVFGSEKSRVSIASAGVGSSQCAYQIPSPFLPVFAKVSVLLVLDLRRGHFSSWFSVHRSEFSFVVFSTESPAQGSALLILFCRGHPRPSVQFQSLVRFSSSRAPSFLSGSSFSRWGFSSARPQLHLHKLVFVSQSAFLFTAGLASTLRSSTAVGSILLKLARICSLF